MLDIKSELVDVNVHPSKLQVKFIDSQKIYQAVYSSVYSCLGENKISSVVKEFQNNNNIVKNHNKLP
jgi:DNA mismatch repair protein MutL